MRFSVVYADPPWPYYGSGTKDAAAGKHYGLMSLESICGLPVREVSGRSAALFLWATCPRLPDALACMGAWGFHYRGVAYVWVKTARDGRPLGARGVPPTFVKPVCELVLVGSTCERGRPLPILTSAQRQVVFAPVGRHSEKPAEVARRIEELFGDVPRLELFARMESPGWTCVGDEIDGRCVSEALKELAGRREDGHGDQGAVGVHGGHDGVVGDRAGGGAGGHGGGAGVQGGGPVRGV